MSEPMLTIADVTAAHGKRAVRWLRNRSLAASYKVSSHELCAFEFKQGRDWTYEVMKKALAETRF